ncbi:MAG: type I DNA topoisomerase [Spirochaetes bacterium]|nr:type I DNA topoisomerase [Spirochaetota bacterium]
MNLIVVESPSKAKTIEKYLGKDYKVISTKGHIKDLPKWPIAVDIENGFEAKFVIKKDRKKEIEALKELSKKAENILIASDNDREGEAIAAHVKEIIEEEVKNANIKRVVFNEITKKAILDSLKNPRDVDQNKVSSQKARRVLDRLVGYKVSPILIKKAGGDLSAGRVQTVALRMIVEREKEREKFIPEKYYKLIGSFLIKKDLNGSNEIDRKKIDKKYIEKNKDLFLIATAINYNGKKIDSKDFEIFQTLEQLCKRYLKGELLEIKSRKSEIKNKPPYITATLQQEAFSLLNFPVKKTMLVAQTLYEGVEIGSTRMGLITYMRTDSTRVSQTAKDEVKEFIIKNYGENNYFYNEKLFSISDELSQDAHEAIRPTDVSLTPEKIKEYLNEDQFKLYSIIWERFVSSFMKPVKIEVLDISINYEGIIFKTTKRRVVEKGYLEVYKKLKLPISFEEFPDIKKGELFPLYFYELEKNFTEPPARYDEGTLIKKLKESGIGRPSTYATIVSTLKERNYVVVENKKLVPTKIGKIVCDLLVENFPEHFKYDFTREMEEELDKIENGNSNYLKVLKGFWNGFEPYLQKFLKIESVKDKIKEETSIKCELCGGKMIKKFSKYGEFVGCENYPKCKNIKNYTFGVCPQCGTGLIIKRVSKNKKKYFAGCSNFPNCNWVGFSKKLSYLKCDKCGELIVNINGEIFKCVNKDCGKEFSKDDLKKLKI